MNKFSIILPVYNGGEYVKECVQSILAQTVREFNLHILDNNSKDGTVEWLTSLQDERLILHTSTVSLSMEENWGRVKDIPKNEYITLIGHDDMLLPHYLSEMNELILKHPGACLYQTHYAFIDAKGEVTGACLPMDEMQYGHEFLACQLARTMNSMGTGYMMRSKDYDALGGMPVDYPNLIFADYQLWVQLTMLSYKATSNNTCFKYRIHNSISRLTNGEKYQQAFGKYVQFLAALMKESDEVKEVIKRYAKGMLMYNCESLSHRLLKTPVNARKRKVSDFIAECKSYAAMLIPDQQFDPSSIFRIRIAEKLDKNAISRSAFYFMKKITG